MGQHQPRRAALGDHRDRRAPQLEVDIGRRRRQPDGVAGRDPHPGDVAHERRPGAGIQVDDVMGGVAGSGEHLEALDDLAAGERDDVALGHRDDLAPELVHAVAVEPPALRSSRDGSIRCGAPASWT